MALGFGTGHDPGLRGRRSGGLAETRCAGWGDLDGESVRLCTLEAAGGLVARVTSYGAILTEVHVPDSRGRETDVALGFDRLAGYLGEHPHFGGTVGRVGNRIAHGRFELDGKPYELARNEGNSHHLHGGEEGFDRKLWEVVSAEGGSVTLRYRSPDGEEGYPGSLVASVTYAVTDENALSIDMETITESPTLVNLVNHSYWNLSGHDAGDVRDHELEVRADAYTPTDAEQIPTGEIAPVAGTPFDLRTARVLRDAMAGLARGVASAGGFDHNFVLRDPDAGLRLVAALRDPESGRLMRLHTDQPGMQLYTANHLDGSIPGKSGARYPRYAAICLETQCFPDAIHQEGRPGWPSAVLRPGEAYRHRMLLEFSAS